MPGYVSILRVLIILFILFVTVTSNGIAQKSESYKDIEKRDHNRDDKLKAKPLQKDKKYWRYAEKKKDLQRDLHPKEHLTPSRPGRPPGPKEAKSRFGLKKEPNYRADVIEKKGQPMKDAKVIGGKPGFSESTPQKKTPKENILNIVKLHKGASN